MKIRLLSTLVVVAFSVIVSHVAPAFANSECDPASAYLDLAREQYDAGEFALSMSSYSCALVANPDSATAYLGRGNAARNLGQFQQAIDDYTHAIELREGLAIAYNNRGWAYYNLGDYNRALADYNRALELDPNLAYAYNNRGLVVWAMGTPDTALSDFNRASTLGLDWALYNLGQLEASGVPVEPPPAFVSIEEQVNQALIAADAVWDAGDWRAAIDGYTAVLELDPNNVTALQYRADSFYSVDAFGEALVDYERAVELAPDNPFVIWGRAYTRAALDDFDGAYLDYQRAAALAPDHVNNHYVLGAIEAMAGNMEKAGEEFFAVIESSRTERIEREPVTLDDRFSIEMADGLVYAVPFEGESGQLVSLHAHSGDADVLLVLLDPDEKPIAGDDDSCTELDPMITSFALPADGTYTLLITHAGGGSYGIVDVTLSAI